MNKKEKTQELIFKIEVQKRRMKAANRDLEILIEERKRIEEELDEVRARS